MSTLGAAKAKGELRDSTRLNFGEEHFEDVLIGPRNKAQGGIHFIQDSHGLAEMLQTHRQHWSCSYLRGGERVNFP